MIPIEKRAAEYALNERGPLPRGDLAPQFTDRVFTLRAAMGVEEGVVDFNIGMGPACSSLPEKKNTSGFWCVKSIGKVRVNKFMHDHRVTGHGAVRLYSTEGKENV
jgi:hypothetical protein